MLSQYSALAEKVKTQDGEYLVDHATGPRTLPFPAWSPTARWHEDLACYVHGARYWPDFSRRSVRVYLREGDCADFTGTLYAVLSAGVPVDRIETFSGSEADTVFTRGKDGAWVASRPTDLIPHSDLGEEFLLPHTHEAQEPATWSPPMPFERRSDTARAVQVAAIREAGARKITKWVEQKKRELDRDRVKAIASHNAALDARLGLGAGK